MLHGIKEDFMAATLSMYKLCLCLKVSYDRNSL